MIPLSHRDSLHSHLDSPMDHVGNAERPNADSGNLPDAPYKCCFQAIRRSTGAECAPDSLKADVAWISVADLNEDDKISGTEHQHHGREPQTH